MRSMRVWAALLALGALAGAVQAASVVLPEGVGCYVEGGTLPSTSDYSWWYGCSPTSAGMVLGYYDRNGYAGLSYANLVPGGTAEAGTYPSTAGTWTYLAQYAIASPGHVNDFYRSGYQGTGDDIAPTHSFNCLADFMGTSQDSVGNPNGATSFHYFNNGKRYTAADALNEGVANRDGMYGIGEYIQYAGYSYDALYTQLTDNVRKGNGFTFEDYKNEIDAGRGLLVHVQNQSQGHTMTGVGYDNNGNIIVYDTWTTGPHTMAWGGSYDGLDLWGVTAFELTDGSGPVPTVPAPGALLLASIGAGAVRWLRRSRTLL